jgi:hypothetical protein
MGGKSVVVSWNDHNFRVVQAGKHTVWDDELRGYRTKYKVKIEHTYNGTVGIQKTMFFFFGSIKEYENGKEKMTPNDRIFALYYFISDAITYLQYDDLDRYGQAFGFRSIKKLIKVFNGCKRFYRVLREKFGLLDDDVFNLMNHIQTTYEEIL